MNTISRISAQHPAKIAWLHSHFLQWSGGTKFIFEVAKRIHPEIPITIFVEQSCARFRRMFKDAGVEVKNINTLSSTSPFYWTFFPFFFRRNVRKISKIKGNFSCFVSSMFPMNFAAVQAGVEKHLAYILEPFAFFHDPDMISGHPFLLRFLLRTLSSLYGPWDIQGVQKATQVMTINHGTGWEVKKIYGRDSKYSFLGVDSNLFSPQGGNPFFKKLRDRYAGRKVIVHSTDFTPLKKTWDAVRIVEELKNEMPEVKLLITQSFVNRAETARLRKYIKDRHLKNHIELVGYVDHHELPCYYSVADVALYTGIGSGASAASLFVLECMACGTPAVRTDFTKEEVEHNISGFLYKAGDTKSLKKYLLALLRDDKLRNKFSPAARRKIIDVYNWDSVAQRMLKTIRELIAR